MWIMQKILSVLLFPIHLFWEKYEEYKKEESVIKIIIFFILSLSGVAIIGITLIWGIVYVSSYYPEWIVIIGLIVWLYAYIKSKKQKKTEVSAMQNAQQEIILTQQQQQMQEQAMRGYPLIRNILYQTLKVIAESIGGNSPRLLAEIEIPEAHFIFANGICFYQFKLAKADIRMNYMREELQEFERILQTAISRKIQSGDFPTLGTGTYPDAYGNLYDAVIIDIIEDINTYLVIQAVFYSPAYADYTRQKQLNLQGLGSDTSIPDETWRNMS